VVPALESPILKGAGPRHGFPAAWDVTTGAEARVAVLDTGVDASHPDLAGKILTAESIDGSDPRADSDGHGTHVAGLACASTDDGVGIAGAGWGCGLHIVKLGVDVTGRVPDEDIVRGLELAIAHSPHAINMSFGGGPDSAALGAAIQAAYERGIVLVAAASNSNGQGRQGAPASMLQPGDAENLDAGRGLVVTAADFEDTRAGTGRGSGISLAAYGFYDETRGPPGLISTYPGAFTLRDLPACSPVTRPDCNRRDIAGVETTIPFCRFVMSHEAFRSGSIHTGFVDAHFSPEMLRPNEADDALASALAAAAIATRHESRVT
jgi:subtilisin family serine protease